MFSKFSHANPPYPINNVTTSLTDGNNNNPNAPNNNNNIPKNNFTHHHANHPSQNSPSPDLMDSNEFRNMDEEEDDVDSLNINFDDVNDQSDIDDYYNNCSEQSLNANNINNNDLNNCANLINKNENCLYEMGQHYNHFSSKLPNNLNQNQNKQIANNKLSYITSSSILESVISNEINSSESTFGMPNSTKPNNRNIHCVKEKIRRDRIKMSCNQLRKLVPNVSGFKTDMASLLETSVLWAQLINSNVPEQYLNNIKAKLASLATIKNSNQIKNLQQMQTANGQNLMNQKYKSNYEYLINKNQQENVQQRHGEMQNPQSSPSPTSILSTLNAQQLDVSSLTDVANNLSSLPASLNLKPNAWLPYSFQLNNEANNQSSQKILTNIAQSTGNHQLTPNYTEFYDKIIKKSPSNTNFNFER